MSPQDQHSPGPIPVQNPTLTQHPNLGEQHRGGFARLTIVICVLLIGFGVLWASQTKTTELVTGTGTISPAASTERIEHPDGGVIAALPAKEGEKIAAGALLARLDVNHLMREQTALIARKTRWNMKKNVLSFDIKGNFNPGPPYLRGRQHR